MNKVYSVWIQRYGGYKQQYHVVAKTPVIAMTKALTAAKRDRIFEAEVVNLEKLGLAR